MQTFLIIYVTGALAVVALTFVKIILNWAIRHLTGLGYYWKNCERIGIYVNPWTGIIMDKKPVKGVWIAIFIVEPLLSWINVLMLIVQISLSVIGLLKVLFNQLPNSVLELRHPLFLSLDIPIESVWARVASLAVVSTGKQFTWEQYREAAQEIRDNVPAFDTEKALKTLLELGFIKMENDSNQTKLA